MNDLFFRLGELSARIDAFQRRVEAELERVRQQREAAARKAA